MLNGSLRQFENLFQIHRRKAIPITNTQPCHAEHFNSSIKTIAGKPYFIKITVIKLDEILFFLDRYEVLTWGYGV